MGKGVFDGLVSDLVVAGDAVGVDGQQHVDAVPGAGGDLGGRRAEASHSDSAACRRS